MRSLLISGALAAALALAAGVKPADADSLADALIKAYQTSPLLQSNRAALRSQNETIPQAKANLRPQVSLGLQANTQSTVENIAQQVNNTQAALDVSLTIFDNGQTKAAVESARNTVAAGRADLKGVEQQVLFSAVQAYVDVRRAEEFVQLGQNDVDRLTETLDATRNRFDVGEVTRTDVSQSESRLAASRSSLSDARGALEAGRQAYLAAVGSPAHDLARLPPLPAVPKSLDAATQVGIQRNPAIISAQFRERSAVYDFDRARAAKGPTIGVSATGGFERGNNQFGAPYDGNTFAQAGIGLSMPLYTGGRNDSLIRQAQDVLDQRRFELQDTGRQVTQGVANAFSQLDVARANIVARREQADSARIAAEGVAEEARLGARSTLDVLDADQERLQAEAEIVQALADEYVATYSLLQAMGLLTVEHLKLGIATYDPDVDFRKVRNGPPGGYDTKAVDRIRSRWERP